MNTEKNKCSEEQIKKCHGDVTEHPCDTDGCQKPGGCSQEQIRKCHGDMDVHPCDKKS